MTGKDKALTHARHCDEWGNNILTRGFHRLQVNVITRNLKCALLQCSSVLLHNWRVESCSRNHFKKAFEHLQNEDKY